MGRSLLFLVQKRFLKTSAATLSPTSPLLTSAAATTTTSSSTSSFIVECLINSCGLPSKSALSVSKKLRLSEKNLQNPQSVLQFFKAHDFSDTHIAKLILKTPRILLCSVEDTLRPKFNFLIEIGFVGRLLPDIITADPYIVWRSLDSHLKSCFQLLRPFFDSNEKFGESVSRCSWLLSGGFKSCVETNIDFLTKEGVPANCIGKLLLAHPRSISQKHDRFVSALTAVKDLGFDPKTTMFVHAIGAMMRMSESTWNKKIEVMKSLGWSEEETLSAFKRYPFFMECSEEKMRRAVDFYLNTIKMERQDIILNPVLIMFSIDKRVRPRWDVLQVLKSNHLLEKEVKMKPVLLMPEKKFLEKYVTSYADRIPDLLKICQGTGKPIDT